MGTARGRRWWIGAAVAMSLGAGVLGQPQLNPVYVDDAPAAADTMARVRDHLASGNTDEAVRVLQALLDEHPDRVTPSARDDDVFVSVRSRVHEVLLADPGLLERYRALQGPRAAAIMDGAPHALTGPIDQVERSLLLTSAGFEAALRVAQRQLEDARFEAARLTLAQLESHPDRLRGGRPAQEAAELLSTVATYIGRGDVAGQAARWHRDAQGAGEAPPTPPTPASARPSVAIVPGLSPLGPLPPLDTKGLIAKPLWTIDLRAPAPADLNPAMPAIRGTGGAASIPLSARDLVMLPTVTDDLVIVNDGLFVSAWDRFTLSPRWTVQPVPAAADPRADEDREIWRGRMWGSASGPEATTVTVWGPYAAAATGRSQLAGGGEGDDRIHGIDPRTGRLRWSVRVSDLDPSLAESTVRGPLEISEGVVIAAVRKHAQDRRLVSLSLLGLDAETGRMLWLRMLGSAGWLPFGSQSFGADATAVDRGVAYRADELGSMAAVEIDSGRTRWVRRMPVETGTAMRESPQAWEVNRPIVDGDQITLIAPDGRRIVRLEAHTGAVLAERQASQFSQPPPTYLLRAGSQLAAISPGRIALVPMENFDSAPVKSTPAIEDPGIRGRVCIVGDKLLTPLVRGLALIDPLKPDAEPLTQALDKPGNVLAVGSQLLVLDDQAAHSYLQWDVAEGILRDRMTGDPKDPTPAVTYAELAYRAGKFDRVAGAVDSALAAFDREPASERNIAQRQRLFETVHTMVSTGLEAVEAQPPAEGEEPRQGALPRLTDRPTLGALIDRLARAADTADDRVAVTLASGRLSELKGDATAAAAAYQRVLDEPALAVANWRGPSVSVRAELEAARRLEQLIAEHGPSIYAPQDAMARQRLAELGAGATAADLEQLAARFPLSAETPNLYLRLADLHKAAGHPREAIAALEAGFKSAQRIVDAPQAAVGELAGRLVTDLRERQQPAAAAAALRNIRRRSPTLVLTSAGQPLDADRLGAELAERIAAITRWPRIGQLTGENAQAISGWSILTPWLREFSPHVNSALVMKSEREVGVFVVEKQGERAGQLGKLWGRPFEDGDAELIRLTSDAAFVLLTSDRSGGLERVPLPPAGAPDAAQPPAKPDPRAWRTEPMSKLFPPGDESRGMQRVPGIMQPFETPDDGIVRPDDLLPVMDEQTIVLVQRGGRALAIDSDTGEVLWQADTGVSQVYDAHLVGGTLVVAGEIRKTNAAGALEDLTPAVQITDARTGQMGQRLRDLGRTPGDAPQRIRWVRLTDSGQLICGAENAVLSIDLATMQRNWTITNQEMLPASAAWIFGDRLLLLAADRQLWLASVSTGRVRTGSLEAPRARMESTREVSAFTTTANADGPFAVSTYQGLMIFDADGDLQGIDGLGAIDTMLPPMPAEDRAIAIETVSEGRGTDGLLQFQVYALENNAGMLVGRHALALATRPQAAALLDGRIAVSAGSATIVIGAPSRK